MLIASLGMIFVGGSICGGAIGYVWGRKPAFGNLDSRSIEISTAESGKIYELEQKNKDLEINVKDVYIMNSHLFTMNAYYKKKSELLNRRLNSVFCPQCGCQMTERCDLIDDVNHYYQADMATTIGDESGNGL